jgi:hypothetical protein
MVHLSFGLPRVTWDWGAFNFPTASSCSEKRADLKLDVPASAHILATVKLGKYYIFILYVKFSYEYFK